MQYFGIFLGFDLCDKKINFFWSQLLLSLYLLSFACFLLCPASAVWGSEDSASVLNRTLAKTASLRTIASNVSVEMRVDHEVFTARGRYEEQAIPNPIGEYQRSMFRLNLSFQMDSPLSLGSEPNRLTLVCHASVEREKGRIWRYQSIEGTKSLGFIRIAVLEDALNRSNKRKAFPGVSETAMLGGINGMLKNIDVYYEFDAEVTESMSAGTNGVSVFVLKGSLKNTVAEGYLTALGGIDKKGRYPADYPSDIEIHIGKEDCFPYKIKYLQRASEKARPEKTLSEITYIDVLLDGEEIPELQFSTFDKGELPEGVFDFEDLTSLYMQQLGVR